MIYINGDNLNLNSFVKIVLDHELVGVEKESINKVNTACDYVKKVVDSGVPTYGINTGFGQLSTESIDKKDTSALQENLIKSHACGVGEPLKEAYVRGMLLLRVNALIKGYSGIRYKVIEKMLELLNNNVLPVVYSQGSLGASGDLAPLSHMALPLIGLGEVLINGNKYHAKEGLNKVGIEPLSGLVAKEGLALINGTQAITSIAAVTIYHALNLFNLSVHTLGLTMEALHGITDVFDSEIHQLRNQSGQQFVASRLRDILSDSKLTSTQGELRVQDAYSLRCSPQVLGASLDAINYVYDVIEKEMNAVTDNPLVFAERQKVISAGNFHGQPLALAMDFLAIAMSELANISERRLERMVNSALSNGLPPFLVKKPGLNSGFMIVQYSAASLVSENKVLSHPASVDSIPSSANQEDHVSMGNHAARKAGDIVENAYKVISMELLTTLQAVDFSDPNNLSSRTKKIYDFIRKDISFIEDDVLMYERIHKIEAMVKTKAFIKMIG
ncbi:MAG: histidine ammonia-lyase [Tenericutes bacterium]|nr:histidine ammonia-lyase [Mycoplasmatota bacterium]